MLFIESGGSDVGTVITILRGFFSQVPEPLYEAMVYTEDYQYNYMFTLLEVMSNNKHLKIAVYAWPQTYVWHHHIQVDGRRNVQKKAS